MKNPNIITLLSTISVLAGILFFSCKKNKAVTCNGTDSTYNSNIKDIINNNCTSSGCHPGYSTYAGIKPILDNGKFNSEVLQSKSMPEGKKLSDSELSVIKCWVDGGYKEN